MTKWKQFCQCFILSYYAETEIAGRVLKAGSYFELYLIMDTRSASKVMLSTEVRMIFCGHLSRCQLELTVHAFCRNDVFNDMYMYIYT